MKGAVELRPNQLNVVIVVSLRLVASTGNGGSCEKNPNNENRRRPEQSTPGVWERRPMEVRVRRGRAMSSGPARQKVWEGGQGAAQKGALSQGMVEVVSGQADDAGLRGAAVGWSQMGRSPKGP